MEEENEEFGIILWRYVLGVGRFGGELGGGRKIEDVDGETAETR